MFAGQAEAKIPPIHQVIALETRTIRTVSALDAACEAVRELETAIEAFLDEYYAHVGTLFEELERVERELGVIRGDFNPQYGTKNELLALKSPKIAENISLKSLYRRLAKAHHPDVSAQSNAEWMSAINEAYARSNMAELLRLEWSQATAKSASPEQQIESLERQCQQLQSALEAAKQRQTQLKQSGAYALMCKALQLRLAGQDFMAQVKDHVCARIAQKKREVLIAKCLKTWPVSEESALVGV